MKVKVDRNECIGCGACAAMCDTVFEMGKDNKSKIVNVDAGTEPHEAETDKDCAKEAAGACPATCIHVN
jgi:ferredoxin